MKLFQVIQMLDDEVRPEDFKIHCAVHNGTENPLDVYLAGEFDRWQEWQTNLNFKRKYVLSLIQLPSKKEWLFSGVHESLGYRPRETGSRCYRYNLSRCEAFNELCGRLVINFVKPGRQSYLIAENWVDQMHIAEFRAEKIQIADFSGFTQTMLTKKELDILVKQQIVSWKSALSSVAGVYVISDTETGHLYIGSATGDRGIWGRWCQYSKTGHGGNKELKALLKDRGPEYANNFLFGILETVDSSASANDVIIREIHWKNMLLSRSHGYNSN